MGRRTISRPIPGYGNPDILSYYVFYEDKSPVGLCGGAAKSQGDQTMISMTGVNFADKAKYEILQLRQENEFLRKEVAGMEKKLNKMFKERYYYL